MKSKAQKGPDVRKNWREKKRGTTLRIAREQYISWPTESPPPATIIKSGTVADKSPLLTYPMGHRLTLCLQKIPQRLFQSSKPVIAGSTLFASILANVVSAGGFGVCACCRSSGGVVGTVPGAACGEKCASFYVLNPPFYHPFHPIQTRVSSVGGRHPSTMKQPLWGS